MSFSEQQGEACLFSSNIDGLGYFVATQHDFYDSLQRRTPFFVLQDKKSWLWSQEVDQGVTAAYRILV